MNFKEAIKKSAFSILKILPMFIAIVWLVGIFQVFVTPKMLSHFFNGSYLHDTITSIISGSVTIGQVVLSCIIEFALLKKGVTLYAVTVFFLAFTTIGIIQMPLQMELLGKKFTIIQNFMAIIFIVISSYIIFFLMGIL
jgi:uncharacterized membrane protein YraQ (UPF0718 family)